MPKKFRIKKFSAKITSLSGGNGSNESGSAKGGNGSDTKIAASTYLLSTVQDVRVDGKDAYLIYRDYVVATNTTGFVRPGILTQVYFLFAIFLFLLNLLKM